MNQIGLLEQLEELRRMSQQIHFLNGKARADAKRKKVYFQLLRRVRRVANVCCAIWSRFAGTWRVVPICYRVGVWWRRSPMPHR